MYEASQIEAGGQILPMPLASITIDGVTHNLMRHPELFNMKHINEWIDDYTYTEHYKVPVKYEKRSPLWIQARRVYEYYFNGAKAWLVRQSNK